MQYIITGQNDRHFEVANELQTPIGRLDYTTWLPDTAQITTIDNNLYDIDSADFWNTTKAITKNGMAYAKLKPDWQGGLVLALENGPTFIFKKRSLWASDFILMDEAENEIAVVLANFKWNKLNFDYEIEVHNNVFDRETNLVLPLILIYCIKYKRMRGSAIH